MRISNRRVWLLTIPVLLALTFLLLRVIWNTSMHPDETLVYVFTRFDIGYAVHYLATQDIQAPLWLALFWIWRHLLAGDSEFSGRMIGLLFSVVTLAMTYRIGRDWFGKARYGFFSMIILGVSAYFLDFGLEIRPYPLVLMLAAISMWLHMRWLKKQTWRLALCYGLVTALLLYAHYFVGFLIIVQVIYFLLSRPSRRLLTQAFGAVVLVTLLLLPWLPSFFTQVKLLHEVVVEAGNGYGSGIGTPSTTQPTNGASILSLAQITTNGQILLYALVLVIGAALLWRNRRYRLVLLWGLGVPVIALAINLVLDVYTERYVAYLTVGFALAIGAALAAITEVRLRYGAALAFLAINLIVMPAWLPDRIPYRDLYPQMAAQPGDVVFNTPPSSNDQFLQYQQQHYLPAEAQGAITTDLTQAQNARRVWFMTASWFDPEVQAQFHQLEPTHPVQQVIGQCPEKGWCYLIQLMEAPPLTSALRFGSNMDFWGADVEGVSATAITAHLWWRVEQTPNRDYSISLRLLNDQGVLIAQKDGPINHYGTQIVQTSQLEPGKIYIDWRTLDLSPEIPAGQYKLVLIVYQSWDGQRLKLPDGADSLMLKNLTIP